ncbi:MAG: YciI family protein [Gaiella sp.]
MEYLALIHTDDGAWQALGEEERQAVYAEYRALSEEARAAGVLVDGAELASVETATTVRVRDGQTLVSDGPYAEVKEALGGYFLFDCASIDDAVHWAARIPAAATGAVEVRPVHVDSEA